MAGNGATILVDMDGVLADFDARAMSVIPTEEHIKRVHFYLGENYPEHQEKLYARMSEPDFFTELGLIDGAIEGWQLLLDNGYDPRICSAPLRINEHSVEGKIKFLEKYFVKYFGPSIVDRAIIDKQKYNYDGLVLIDDRPEVDTGNGVAQWQHVVFDQSYNQASSASVRIMGWRDPLLIEKLDAIQRSRQKNSQRRVAARREV